MTSVRLQHVRFSHVRSVMSRCYFSVRLKITASLENMENWQLFGGSFDDQHEYLILPLCRAKWLSPPTVQW